MSKLWERMLLVPSVVRLASRAPKDPAAGWEGYWRGIHTTGHSGDVLWDSGSRTESEQYADAVVAHFDPTLPVIDVGCGNGTYTRWLAGLFPSVLGLDVSSGAVELAKREAEGLQNTDFMVLDAAEAGAGERLLERMGPANIFVRGVFHVLKPNKQASMAANLRTVIRSSGRVFLTETNFPGNSLAYLQQLGATRRSMPPQLQSALENLPRPGRFGAQERNSTFPDADWQLVTDGPVNIEVVSMGRLGLSQQVPGYFAVLAGA
ncbi:class I SAM-dependent methyltransferase [Cryobacterium psychrophilum]|uniref:Class I SAM-dependent methyltransferase n=1 Tax=Cryobacterium psychrophilum TaxID=41988 RepID=A0A4Y8KJ12_9MICO|nr:class I SAM-dependent methyltransferase [Cryobacterium psychrophilum]TDW28433.1 methyltransferase family protein [Cryobacterium psychrophilum]TFD75112.1 class I SAM-dependent methyltransferase [Cryobacterium psychrophilum]